MIDFSPFVEGKIISLQRRKPSSKYASTLNGTFYSYCVNCFYFYDSLLYITFNFLVSCRLTRLPRYENIYNSTNSTIVICCGLAGRQVVATTSCRTSCHVKKNCGFVVGFQFLWTCSTTLIVWSCCRFWVCCRFILERKQHFLHKIEANGGTTKGQDVVQLVMRLVVQRIHSKSK